MFLDPFRDAPGRGDEPPRVGLLLSNLGTPDAPTRRALRPYLAEFLSDPRVIELPRWKWWPVLHLFVLPRRPAASARLYREVWTEQGSPLLVHARNQLEGVRTRLAARFGDEVAVELGMRYGEPSIGAALRRLAAAGCDRVVVLPLYPQYSGSTTGSTFDAVFAELTRWRRVPGLRTVESYHDEPAYVRALADSVRELWRRDGEPDLLLMSFHGMPVRYAEGGDPYPEQCHATARRLAAELGLPERRWRLSFQSLFGREEWLKPYTDETVGSLPASGVRRLDVVCPGFSADCLETIEEIDGQNRKIFLDAGGERFRFVPCLNDRSDHLDALAAIAARQIDGWRRGARHDDAVEGGPRAAAQPDPARP